MSALNFSRIVKSPKLLSLTSRPWRLSLLALVVYGAADMVSVYIRETLIQITVYCGVPAGVTAFRLAREVFDAEGIEVGD